MVVPEKDWGYTLLSGCNREEMAGESQVASPFFGLV